MEVEIYHFEKGNKGPCRHQLPFFSDSRDPEAGGNRLENPLPAGKAFSWRKVRSAY
jgi:hypothetical protein